MKTPKKQQKVIVPVDFSNCSLAAVEVGAQFARWHGSELVLLHILEEIPHWLEILRSEHTNEKAREKATEKLEAIQKVTPGVEVSHMFGHGKPYKAILEIAEDIDAELIVMGTLGEDAEAHDYVVGSNVNRVLRHAEAPVVTVKEAPKDLGMDNILIPVDTEFGIRELRSYLKTYKSTYNPTIHVASVVTEDSSRKEEVTNYLNKQKAALHKMGLDKVEIHLLEGDIVSQTVLEFTKENDIDMIWMETHGRTGLGNLLLGSKTEEVLVGADVPVFCLRPDRAPVARGYYSSNIPV